MMDNHGNKVVYSQEQLTNIAKVEIIPQLKPQNPDELRRRGCRAGAKRRQKRRTF